MPVQPEQAAGVGIPHPSLQMLGLPGEESISILLLSPRGQGFSRLGFAPRAVDAGREMLGHASAAPPEAKAVPVPLLTNPRKFKKLPQLTWGCSEGAGIGGGTQPACAQNTQEGFCGGFRHIFTQEALLLWSHAVQEVRAQAGQCF